MQEIRKSIYVLQFNNFAMKSSHFEKISNLVKFSEMLFAIVNYLFDLIDDRGDTIHIFPCFTLNFFPPNRTPHTQVTCACIKFIKFRRPCF